MLCCLCDLGLSLVILFTEIVYPARESVKNTQDKGSNTQWITYWCIYFSLYLIETITYVLPL